MTATFCPVLERYGLSSWGLKLPPLTIIKACSSTNRIIKKLRNYEIKNKSLFSSISIKFGKKGIVEDKN
jgi:hypothetical protein